MEKKIKVLYLGSIEGYESTLNVLSDFANVINVPPKIELLSDQIEDADAILDASMKTSISEELLKNANKLKIISCATKGSDHISTNALIERKISLKTLKEDGVLYFSNNKRDFKLSTWIQDKFKVKDVSKSSIPIDFRDLKIHRCFEIRHQN